MATPVPDTTPPGTPEPPATAPHETPDAAMRAPAPGDSPAETEGQPDPEEKGPLRRCIVTRESLPKGGMIRFVLAPGRVLVPDLAGRLPGRGMWLSARADVLERALTRGAFMKAARGPVHPPNDLRATIEDGLRRRIRDLVGFARRAGQAVVGFQQAREWLQAGRAGLLVEATDGSAAERARLVGGHETPIVSVLTAAELGGLFGRDHAVHVAVASGKLAQGIAQEAARLSGLRATGGAASGMEKDARAGGARRTGRPDGAKAAAPQDGVKTGRPDGTAETGRPTGGDADQAPRRGDRHGKRPRRDGSRPCQ
jgi:predicted RNA-binding protein YlxR (DUF448 family)